jgi:hypothetical protein
VIPRPPRILRALLSLLSPPDERAFVLGDLDEEFAERSRETGPGRAWAWYARQTIGSLVPLALMRAGRRSVPQPRSPAMFSDIGGDARFTWRQARRHPVASAAVVLTIALALSSGAAVGTITAVVLLKPLPLTDAGRVVRILDDNTATSGGGTSVSAVDMRDLRERSREFAAITTFCLTNRWPCEWHGWERDSIVSSASIRCWGARSPPKTTCPAAPRPLS